MVTYFYWLLVAALVFGALFAFGVRMGKWKPAIISEYSRGNVLEGRVVLKNCNPINLQQPPALPLEQ